jgi:jacalin-like lectin domain-containing protein
MAQQGPSGGNGGSPFFDKPPSSQIRQIIVHYGAYVNKIEVHYDDGTVFVHGNQDAPGVDLFRINQGDALTGITGITGNSNVGSGSCVVSIGFISAAGVKSPVWGGVIPGPGGGVLGAVSCPGSHFVNLAGYSYSAPAGQQITAFFGRSSDYIDQIGIITA